MHEIQILVRGKSLGPLLSRGAALVRGALQVEPEVHPHGARKQIVHDDNADVLARSLNTIQPVKLWQQGAFVLVQVLGEDRERGENKIRSLKLIKTTQERGWSIVFGRDTL